MGFVGLNLTVPHKLLAVDMVDALDETGRKWGAVNTLRFEGREPGGEWRPVWRLNPDQILERRALGFNTDADAVVRAIQEDLEIDLSQSRVLVTGVGGAGKVAALRLVEARVRELYLVNRTIEKCHEVAERGNALGSDSKISVGYPTGKIDLVLNATSLGLRAEDAFPIDLAQFEWGQATHAYDMIYTPHETEFLKEAKANGLRVANGLGMLLYQGVRALEIWSEQAVPEAAMRAALRSHVYGDQTGR